MSVWCVVVYGAFCLKGRKAGGKRDEEAKTIIALTKRFLVSGAC